MIQCFGFVTFMIVSYSTICWLWWWWWFLFVLVTVYHEIVHVVFKPTSMLYLIDFHICLEINDSNSLARYHIVFIHSTPGKVLLKINRGFKSNTWIALLLTFKNKFKYLEVLVWFGLVSFEIDLHWDSNSLRSVEQMNVH